MTNPSGALSTVDALMAYFPELNEIDGLDLIETATIYRGDVILEEGGLLSLALEHGKRGTLVVIDGDLMCTASCAHWGAQYEFADNAVLVTGQVILNNLHLCYVGMLIVRGDMIAENILMHSGDDGGCLYILGGLKAEVIISITYFLVSVEGAIEVNYVIGDDTYATDFASTLKVLSTERDANVFVDEVFDNEDVAEYVLFDRLVAGEPVFVNNGKPRLGS